MPPKRKSDVILDESEKQEDTLDKSSGSAGGSGKEPEKKKARVTGASSSRKTEEPKAWHEIVLDGEDEGDMPIYDDCNEIRRKIRLLQKEPGFKVTHWLKEIGGINSNSFGRFMKASGPTGGAENGTYYSAYIYFEKVRIATGKKKTAKRIRNEEEQAGGLPREDRKHVWVFTGR